jgi:hypothetical protein
MAHGAHDARAGAGAFGEGARGRGTAAARTTIIARSARVVGEGSVHAFRSGFLGR